MKARVIAWDADKLAKLIEARNEALANRQTSFSVVLDRRGEAHEFNVSFAGYTIEYIETLLAANPTPPLRPNKEGKEGQ